MKLIPLSQGKSAMVDDEDYEWLSQWKWCLHSKGYAVRGNGTILMHCVIVGTPVGFETDHINQNKLDNRRSNLRLATRAQNQRNKPKRRDNTSGFQGVYFDKSRNKFVAEIHLYGKKKHLGRFDDIQNAAKAYRSASIELHQEFSSCLQGGHY